MGSGKTTAATYLAAGSVCINADALAKEVMNSDAHIRAALAAAFGSGILKDGAVDSAALGSIVFASLPALKKLNALVHPPVIAEIDKRIASVTQGLCVVDAALIPLWQTENRFSALYWIEAAAETRLARLVARGPCAQDEIRRRMRLQQELFLPPQGAPWRIVANQGSVAQLLAQLDTIKTEIWKI
jgi:dephospho-CoA kinase